MHKNPTYVWAISIILTASYANLIYFNFFIWKLTALNNKEDTLGDNKQYPRAVIFQLSY